MRYLFVHQNFPAQFLHLLRHLVAQQKHDIVFVGEANQNRMDGVRRVLYQMPAKFGAGTFPVAADFEAAALRAHAVAKVCRETKKLGYEPDIIIGHHGWGELLNLGDVWPGVPMLGYHEFFYHLDDYDVGFDPEFPNPVENFARIRAKNAVNLLALNNPGHGQTPTAFQLGSYPEWARARISLLPEGVDTEKCCPAPAIARRAFKLGDVVVAPREKLVTYVARDLEPYRGFHVMMRAIPRLLAERPDVRVVMVGGDGVSYGARLAHDTWRDYMLRELGPRFDPARCHFAGKLPYDDYRRLLQRSDAHVYLTYPFVLSWSLRESLSCGCAVVASDTEPVREFIRHRRQGLLTPFHDPLKLADRILELLEDRDLANRLRENARRYAEKNLTMGRYLAAYDKLIDDVIERRVPA